MAQNLHGFTCYFCHKTIINETEMGHVSVCGSVLVPCPNKCGSYIPRIDLPKHKRECVNQINKSVTRLTTTTDYVESFDGTEPSTLSLDRRLDSSTRNLKESFNRLQNELMKINVKLQNFEQNRVGDPSPTAMSQMQHYRIMQMQHKQELERVKYQQQSLYEWKKAIDLQLENLKKSFEILENSKHERDTHLMSFQRKLMEINQIQLDIDKIHDIIRKHHNINTQTALEFTNKMDEFKDFYQQENATFAALWNEHKTVLEKIQNDITEIDGVLNEHKAKHTSIVFDLKTTTQIALETSEKLEIQERQFDEIKRNLEQMKLDLEILEDLVSNDDNDSNKGVATRNSGHIIWKISDFDKKMSTAKELETVVKSPIFYTQEFGYKIRILVYLNGLKKWKDRYCLISIHVLKGEYDDLLKWPCHIEGTVILRDLEDLDYPKNFSKYISAKRQAGDEDTDEPQESSSSYIFIPHTTLMKSKYLKNDGIYLEIRIKSNQKTTETSL